MRSNNIRRLLQTFQALADLGPEMTADRDFPQRARSMLALLMEAVAAQEAALFTFTDKPAMLSSVAAHGFALFAEPAVIPLLPKHVHALSSARLPQAVNAKSAETYFSANGNVAPELFKCVVPLKVGSRLVGALTLGRREGDALYEEEEF